AAARVVSAEGAALTHRVLKSMLLAKLKQATVVLLTVSALGGSAGVFAYPVARQEGARVQEGGPGQQRKLREGPTRDVRVPAEQRTAAGATQASGIKAGRQSRRQTIGQGTAAGHLGPDRQHGQRQEERPSRCKTSKVEAVL